MTFVVRHVAAFVLPVSAAIGIATLLKGYREVGDGFSAGMVVGLGAVVQYLALDRASARRAVGALWALRASAMGLLLLLATTLGPVLFGQPAVSHYPRPHGHVVAFGPIELHTAVLFDLGVFLVVVGATVLIVDRLIAGPERQPPC